MASEQNEGSMSVPFSDPMPCANNCGFWGGSTTMDLCSKCYQDFCRNEEQTAAAKAAVKTSLKAKHAKTCPPPEIKVESTSLGVAAVSDVAAIEGSGSGLEQPAQEKKANRCGGCNKKVGLTGFDCKCGMTFCGAHRYPETHNCTFDFKSVGRNAIAKANPVVKTDKVERF